MSVRFKLALTVFATGLITALLVIAAVIYGFQRFEHETAYRRGNAFLQRVLTNYDNLFELYERRPEEFEVWLRNMVLFEPDTQLYLLDTQGTVLACSGKKLPPGFKVALQPVLKAVGQRDAAYVMGDDPERMDADAVVAVQPVRRAVIRPSDPVVGYLYLVLHTEQLPEGRWEALRMSLTRPALGLVAAVVAFTTLIAVLIIVSVTRPLRRLTDAVSTISRRGLDAGTADAKALLPARTRDEFGQLTGAFEMVLDICLRQWTELRRLDHFRREGVSNLSHDLRSPLTATVACLETLDGRWAGDAGRGDDRRLVEIALRNTRTAARLVQSTATSRSSSSRSSGCTPRASTSASCSTTSGCASPSARPSRASRWSSPRRRRTTAARCRSRRSTSSCSSAPSPIWSTTRSSFARPAPASSSRRCRAPAAWRSASPTPGRASRRPTCRTSSTASTRAATASRRPPARAARGWGWRSSSASSSSTRVRFRSRASPAAGRGCGCRCRRPTRPAPAGKALVRHQREAPRVALLAAGTFVVPGRTGPRRQRQPAAGRSPPDGHETIRPSSR